MRRVRYRIGQFLGAVAALLHPPDEPDDLELTEAELVLFRALPAYDRRHALELRDRLREAGVDDPDLLKLALLHDVGKGTLGGVPLWARPWKVLLEAFAPALWRRIADRPAPPPFPLRPLWVLAHHPRLGAQLADRAGTPPHIVAWIAVHHEPTRDPRLRLFQALDDDAS